MARPKLKAPFPYFGGKAKVAAEVWSRLGDVDNYIEPFCGSAAVLLGRTHPPRIETINDADCMVANFWRATAADPEAVAAFADGPVNEADLHARHRWLVLSPEAREFRRRMRADPDYFDPRVAGWWCWGLCCWIGGGWCTAHGETADGDRKQTGPELFAAKGVTARHKRPQLSRVSGEGGGNGRKLPERMPTAEQCRTGGKGVHGVGPAAAGLSPGRRPHLANGSSTGDKGLNAGPAGGRPQLGDAYARGRGVHGNDDADTCAQRRAWLVDWFGRLRDRLRTVRVCCGDWRESIEAWQRVCGSDSVTVRLGTVGLFFDPPYSSEADRDMNLYAVECGKVAHAVRGYCLERGADPRYRIALAGYEGEGHEALEAAGWAVVEWRAHGGYGNRSAKGKKNARRERLWFSPHCLNPGANLFAGVGDG